MPTLSIPPDLELHYRVDDFTSPWSEPETILMLHGAAESSASWYGWVPVLASHYRLVRPDLRGHRGACRFRLRGPRLRDRCAARPWQTPGRERMHRLRSLRRKLPDRGP